MKRQGSAESQSCITLVNCFNVRFLFELPGADSKAQFIVHLSDYI